MQDGSQKKEPVPTAVFGFLMKSDTWSTEQLSDYQLKNAKNC